MSKFKTTMQILRRSILQTKNPWHKNVQLLLYFTSRVSGRGYSSLSVCLCVSGQTVSRMVAKFSKDIDLDNISDELEGQGHRSRSPSKKTCLYVMFHIFLHVLVWCHGIMYGVVTSYDVTRSKVISLKGARVWGINTPTREVQQHFSVFFNWIGLISTVSPLNARG